MRAALGIILSATLLASCGVDADRRRASSFAFSLSALDYLTASKSLSKLPPAFSRAIRFARGSSDWLSLLKRARAADASGEAGRYVDTADRARKAFPRSEPIAAASALAYLRGGRPVDALALFGAPISPEARPNLWAEAFLASRASKGAAPAKPADYGRLADILGESRPYLGAAAAALSAGDILSARAWLEKGTAGAALAPPELLWDCGLYETLAARPDLGAGAAELALMGDAAWIAGDSFLARRRWERSIALAPSLSWKPYVDLALMSGNKGEEPESYWSRMRAAFLSGSASSARDGALGAYAAYLARSGRVGEAERALAGGGGSGFLAVLALTIKGRSQSEGRFAAELEGLAAERPDDSEVQGAVLRELALRGMFGEVAVLREATLRRGIPLRYGWYYDAAVLAARGDFPLAAAAIAAAPAAAGEGAEGTRGQGSAGPYALGCLYAALGDAKKSAAAYSLAAAAARGATERCSALKALGRALGKSGDPSGAASAYRAAASADPKDAEAAILSRGALGSN
jgi:hypothetical protein